MYTSLVWLAFEVGAAAIPTPVWTHDYGLAMRRATAEGKPLAVFIGSGKKGWTDVCENGEPSATARRLLEEQYVCLYVDAAQPGQRHLVEAFEAERLPMLVVSDRSGVYQAYRQPGALSDARLVQVLQAYCRSDVPEQPAAFAHPAAPVRGCRT